MSSFEKVRLFSKRISFAISGHWYPLHIHLYISTNIFQIYLSFVAAMERSQLYAFARKAVDIHLNNDCNSFFDIYCTKIRSPTMRLEHWSVRSLNPEGTRTHVCLYKHLTHWNGARFSCKYCKYCRRWLNMLIKLRIPSEPVAKGTHWKAWHKQKT
jgi:hypothetical protein